MNDDDVLPKDRRQVMAHAELTIAANFLVELMVRYPEVAKLDEAFECIGRANKLLWPDTDD